MAYQKRYNGDSQGVVNMDRGLATDPAAQIVATGIGRHPKAYKIIGADMSAELGTGGAVEAILRTIQVAGSVVAYQVDTVQLSVICEISGWASDAALQAAIVAIGNRAADANIPVTAYDFTAVTVDSTNGIKIA
jgi:hypothetical protein